MDREAVVVTVSPNAGGQTGAGAGELAGEGIGAWPRAFNPCDELVYVRGEECSKEASLEARGVLLFPNDSVGTVEQVTGSQFHVLMVEQPLVGAVLGVHRE